MGRAAQPGDIRDRADEVVGNVAEFREAALRALAVGQAVKELSELFDCEMDRPVPSRLPLR